MAITIDDHIQWITENFGDTTNTEADIGVPPPVDRVQQAVDYICEHYDDLMRRLAEGDDDGD